jgi:hypothetical protein
LLIFLESPIPKSNLHIRVGIKRDKEILKWNKLKKRHCDEIGNIGRHGTPCAINLF